MSVTFSEISYRYIISDLITQKIPEKTKTHDGLSPCLKVYQNLVLYWLSDFNLFLNYINNVTTNDITSSLYLISNLICRINKRSRAAILNSGGGENKILNNHSIIYLNVLKNVLNSIIKLRKNQLIIT